MAKHQTQFLVRAIGGPQIYEGRPIQEVFINNGVTQEDADSIMKFVASFEAQVVTRKITTIDRIMIPIYRSLYKIRRFLKIIVKLFS